MSNKWQITDDNVPSEEHANNIISKRQDPNSRMGGWEGYEFRVAPSEFHKNGSFQIEARKMKKSFKQLQEQLDQQPVTLEESNLSRLHTHLQNRNLGIITAHRSGFAPEMNVTRNRQLEAAITKAGYGYIHINGHYIEGFGTPNENKVTERAYLVIGKEGDDHGGMKGFLKKHGELFDQDSVLYKQFGEKEAKLIGTSKREDSWPGHGVEHPIGEFHPNRAGEFHSALHNKKTFQFSESFESQGICETPRSNFFSEWGKFLREKAGQ